MPEPRPVQRVITCGYCRWEDDAADMHRCDNCGDYSCYGCYRDWDNRCTCCGISAVQLRIIHNEGDVA